MVQTFPGPTVGPHARELSKLQTELVRMQEWIVHEGLRVMVIFEGRDTAGKGGTIKRIMERLKASYCRVVALGTPTERERTQWYFQRSYPRPPIDSQTWIRSRFVVK